MAASTSALSQTLQGITLTKIKELEAQREKYEAKKNDVLVLANGCTDQRERITRLLRGVEDLYPEAATEGAVQNIRHWLYQAKYDISVPQELLRDQEELLRSKLEVQSRKLSLGHLFASLVTEWMAGSSSSSSFSSSSSSGNEARSEEEAFEVVDRQKQRLQELCDKFERVVFEPLETDEVEIDNFLRSMFEGNEDHEKSLAELRRSIGSSCEYLFSDKSPFNDSTLKWCINGLLAEDLLSDEKQTLLREFLENSVVLAEMADVLNMRFSDIENWDWQAPEGGIPVLPRQQLNGKYRIWMDEDVLQAILIHYIGTKNCVDLKSSLVNFLHSSDSPWKWQTGPRPDAEVLNRRQYYLGSQSKSSESLATARKEQFIKKFFASSLPSSVRDFSGAYGDENSNDANDAKKSGNIKQSLLRTLASEVILHRSMSGEVAVVQTDLEWFATALPHSTIFAVLRFFGFTEPVIAFYKKFLEAPLILHSSPDVPPTGGPRIRRRGVPLAHAPEKLLGELILFVMDIAVNQEDGMLLYRLHDDLWLFGNPEHCARGWKVMGRVANVLGLNFNKHKTGSVYFGEKAKDPQVANALPEGRVQIGHLYLDPAKEKWTIDHEKVGEHVAQLKKQLSECKSVLQWVQTWNSCMGRFFSHTFGEPAHCFGPDHADSILDTYRDMQQTLFSQAEGSSARPIGVVEYLKAMIRERFDVDEIPDAFIYLPEQLGGLGLRNPFIRLLQIRDALGKQSPDKIIKKMYEKERRDYKLAKRNFEELGSAEKRLDRYSSWNRQTRAEIKRILTTNDLDTFFTMEEFTQLRETRSVPVREAYLQLRETPEADCPYLDDDVRNIVVVDLGMTGLGVDGSKERELAWALQMYRDGLLKNFGGARLVEEKYLPLGVLTVMRSKAVKWTMVL